MCIELQLENKFVCIPSDVDRIFSETIELSRKDTSSLRKYSISLSFRADSQNHHESLILTHTTEGGGFLCSLGLERLYKTMYGDV